MRCHVARVVHLAVALSMVAASAWAEDAAPLPARSFARLFEQIKPGDRLSVTGWDGREVSGSVETTGNGHLALRVRGSVREFNETDIALVQKPHNDSLLNGAVIGAAAFTLPVAALLAGAHECGTECGAALAVWAGIGAGVGIAVDAAIRGKRTIFLAEAAGAPPRVSVAPILGRDQKGVAFSVRF